MFHSDSFLLFFYGVFLLLVMSCTGADKAGDVRNANRSLPFFGIEAYFNGEATRLQHLNPRIVKSVSKNGDTERREIQIDNWKNELTLFIESEINKPAWRTSYRADSLDTVITYTSLDPALRTQRIDIKKHGDGSVKNISIHNRVTNMLYQSDELLDYYPDSLYRINKRQHVRIIGESHYTVSGTIMAQKKLIPHQAE